MKLNLGCGQDYRHGWINVDREADVMPDVVWDLEVFPWPFDDAVAEEVVIAHLLDEMATATGMLPRFMQELYRVCRDGAIVTVRVTDPHHADAALAPAGGGGLTATSFQSFDLVVNEDWRAKGLRHTPSALHRRIDFATGPITRFLDQDWLQDWTSGRINDQALAVAAKGQNNVVVSSEVVLTARKPFQAGRSLMQADALALVRRGGLGDVLMALSACKAIRSVVDRPIYLLTAPAYRSFAALCPHVDHVVTDERSLAAHARAAGRKEIKTVDLSPVRYGLSRLHEVDAFLHALSLTPEDRSKGLDIDLSRTALAPSAAARLASLPQGSKRIVLHPGVSDPSRTWPAGFWAELAEHCLALEHAVVTIGKARGADGKSVAKLGDGRVLDFSDGLDLAGSLHVLRACDLLISADSGPIQLAGASDIAIIGLYSVVGGDKRLPYRAGSTRYKAAAVEVDCAVSPCYRWMSDPATSEDFTRMEGVGMDNVSAFFSRWCVNPDRYACTRESTTIDKVKALIPTMLKAVDRPSISSIASTDPLTNGSVVARGSGDLVHASEG